MRHRACEAQGDGRTKQEAPGFGAGNVAAKSKRQNCPHQIYSPPNPPLPLYWTTNAPAAPLALLVAVYTIAVPVIGGTGWPKAPSVALRFF